MLERDAYAEADEDKPTDTVEGALDAWAPEDLPPSGGKEGVGQQPNETHRVEQRAEDEQIGAHSVGADKLRQEAREEDGDLGVEEIADEPLAEGDAVVEWRARRRRRTHSRPAG